jgi:hypothetical protein
MTEIERYLEEGRSYIESEDVVQASEKLYKAAEETIKSLAQSYADGIWKEVKEKGRWTSPLLFKAVRQIAEKLGGELRNYWDTAWTLHVEGFHEARLDIDDVKERVENIEKLVKLESERRGK